MDRPRIYVNRILSAATVGTYGLVNEPKEIAHCIKWAFQIEDAEKLKLVAKYHQMERMFAAIIGIF